MNLLLHAKLSFLQINYNRRIQIFSTLPALLHMQWLIAAPNSNKGLNGKFVVCSVIV